MKVNSYGLTAVLSWNLPKRTEKKHAKPQSRKPVSKPRFELGTFQL
jgi:hypothetical protein